MPIEIESFESMSQADFEKMLVQTKPWASSAHPSMVRLMEALAESEEPILVRLRDTQNERSVRSAISNVARHRGLKVQTARGNGLVAVRRIGFITPEEDES